MSKPGRKRFLKEFPDALHEGVGAVFVGAGASIAAGYPSWAELLADIGDELGVKSRDTHDLAALAQWHIGATGNATRVRNIIRQEIGKDHPVPQAIEILARLPVRHIWTTNYDRLIERAFAAIGRPIDTVSGAKNLSLKSTPGAARLYKMHGSVDRPDEIVISTDDYELYRQKHGAFLPLLQAHLSSMSMLFVGLSLTDPNIRHVLAMIRESFTDQPPEHFAIIKPPERKDFKADAEFEARLAQHRHWAKDLSRYGLVGVEIDDYAEVPELLREIESRVADRRVWVSGSWPLDGMDARGSVIYQLAEAIGRLIGTSHRDLVSGSGLVVGSAAIAGFVDALRDGGGWDIDRRLIVRAFPQPLGGAKPDKAQWTRLRSELARQAGVVIFLGGARTDGGKILIADGVLEEFRLATDAGSFLLPIAGFGGAAEQISAELRGSALPSAGPKMQRPTDEELDGLASAGIAIDRLLPLMTKILRRRSKER
ncbi:SIR2-like protein [Bosea sp. AK1]|uniref:SIR2 family protein n=1 Tax=Bosea sp. AK1 TaxID=2587160 RepID=UPI001152589D|nr:SIR2 family protein [Bosea sp. AK1]TQI77235.1 SIR2-like protein [Bosea sp. AK1]